jgi:hypothetical protein
MMEILSLGAGVQSSTLALMAAHGDIGPMPTAAIFADTGAEPRAVYEYLAWVESQVPFPVFRVMHKNGLLDDLLNPKNGRSSNPPLFTEGGGMLRRKCTGDFKIAPIRRKVRELCSGRPVVQWIGISTDEASRMKPSGVKYISHRWPLIERGMSRGDCIAWMLSHGYPMPPKSACTFCPYHNEETWSRMKATDPESWAQAVAVDEAIRQDFAGSRERLYVHRSRNPLKDARLDAAHDRGQTDLFLDECEGMCGV